MALEDQNAGAGDVETGLVTVADATIEYFSQGSGESVVLLPGGTLTVDYLGDLAVALAAAGYRAVRVNPRGAGRSTGSHEGVTLHTFGEDVAGVIEALDLGRVHLAGHAFGNRVARILAADRADLVRSVVLLAAGGKVPPGDLAGQALATIFDPAATDAEVVGAMPYMIGSLFDPDEAWGMLKPSRAPGAAALQRSAVMATSLDDWWAPPGSVQYLALQGDEDQVALSKNGEMLQQELGDRVTIQVLAGTGHLMILEDPLRTAAAVVEFFNGLEA